MLVGGANPLRKKTEVINVRITGRISDLKTQGGGCVLPMAKRYTFCVDNVLIGLVASRKMAAKTPNDP